MKDQNSPFKSSEQSQFVFDHSNSHKRTENPHFLPKINLNSPTSVKDALSQENFIFEIKRPLKQPIIIKRQPSIKRQVLAQHLEPLRKIEASQSHSPMEKGHQRTRSDQLDLVLYRSEDDIHKNVHFRKSVFALNFQIGTIQKQELDGQPKPLKRLQTKKRKSRTLRVQEESQSDEDNFFT